MVPPTEEPQLFEFDKERLVSAAARRKPFQVPEQPQPADEEVATRLARLERLLLAMLERQDDPGAESDIRTPKPAPKTVRRPAPNPDAIDGPHVSHQVARAFRDVPEPRRQRKERHMPARKTYTAATIKDSQVMHTIRDLTPAAAAILVYVTTHPQGATVDELVTQLDLKRKTVANLVSQLRLKKLIHANATQK
jgi:hypothetical protein